MNSNLTPLLTALTKVPIDKFQIDTKNDTIKLNFEKNNSHVTEIVFDEVTSFYYLDHDQEDTIEDESISLNNIMYCGQGTPDFINIHDEDDIAVSIPNFVLELNDSNVFIEANSIIIDKEKYIV